VYKIKKVKIQKSKNEKNPKMKKYKIQKNKNSKKLNS
jgi:hypothetical protein